MRLASCSYAHRPAVGECEFLFVAGRTRSFPVDRHARVIEQIPTQFDLGCRHRIVCRHVRLWEALRQIPRVRLACIRLCGNGIPAEHREHQDGSYSHFWSRTISRVSSIRTERAPALSFGQTSRNGPWYPNSGFPSRLSATSIGSFANSGATSARVNTTW